MPLDVELISKLAQVLGLEKLGHPLDVFCPMVMDNLGRNCPPTSVPKQHESFAITYSSLKVSALAYDRILSTFPISLVIPKDIACYCSTPMEELLFFTCILRRFAAKKNVLPLAPDITKEEKIKAQKCCLRYISRDIANKFGRNPTIIFDSKETYRSEFAEGPQQVLFSALSGIALVEEDSLTWEQVLEFRKDTKARAKYRRLIRWLDGELKSKSPAEIQDLIAIKLDDYEWGIKKHGMKTAIGSVSCVLDPKFLASAAAVVGASTLAGGEFWAALSTTTLAVGKAAISFGKSYIDALDERRKDNYEVAYIHDIKKTAG